MPSKNSSIRLLLPLELHQSYMQIVNNKAKKNAFTAQLRIAFANILAQALVAQQQGSGNITASCPPVENKEILASTSPLQVSATNKQSLVVEDSRSGPGSTRLIPGKYDAMVIPEEDGGNGNV